MALISVLPDAIKFEAEDELFRIYVTDSLQLMVQNKYLTKSYKDIINPKPEDNRTAKEIADDIILRAGLEVINGST